MPGNLNLIGLQDILGALQPFLRSHSHSLTRYFTSGSNFEIITVFSMPIFLIDR